MNTIKKHEIENELKYKNTVILTYRIEYPEITSSSYCYGKNIFNKYNKDKAIMLENYIKNKLYSLEGFVDTGNRLTSLIKKEPVILVNLKIPSKKIIYVPYKALNTEGVISCIRPDKVIVGNKEFNHCLIGLAKDKFNIDGSNCILPNKFKEELW